MGLVFEVLVASVQEITLSLKAFVCKCFRTLFELAEAFRQKGMVSLKTNGELSNLRNVSYYCKPRCRLLQVVTARGSITKYKITSGALACEASEITLHFIVAFLGLRQ